MSGIIRLGNKILTDLGMDVWGNRDVIQNDFNAEIIETNQELQPGAIDASKIKNLSVDTIEVSSTGYIKSGKTSFTDSTNAGYYFSADGIYVGAANDASRLKYNSSTGSLDFIGTLSNSAGAIVLSSAAQTILKDFSFSPSDYSGAFKTGDITWNTTTGAITGGSGGLFNKKGIIFASSGVATITLDGTTGSATFAGAITGGTIGIGSQFSVDNVGNTIVNSLRRNDFHWFTLFESIDGYAKTPGAGSIVCNPGSLDINLGASNNDLTEFQKVSTLYGQFSWDKSRQIKMSVLFQNLIGNAQTIKFGLGSMLGASSAEKIGFWLSNSTLYGVVASGSNYTLLSLGSVSNNIIYTLQAVFVPGVGVDFYKNGTHYGPTTATLPSGTSNASNVIEVYALNQENVGSKQLEIGYYDLWQAN